MWPGQRCMLASEKVVKFVPLAGLQNNWPDSMNDMTDVKCFILHYATNFYLKCVTSEVVGKTVCEDMCECVCIICLTSVSFIYPVFVCLVQKNQTL